MLSRAILPLYGSENTILVNISIILTNYSSPNLFYLSRLTHNYKQFNVTFSYKLLMRGDIKGPPGKFLIFSKDSLKFKAIN